ncbi:MAG TPA: hydroxymethylglutaryl-CoA reductase, degradative [Deltaproteobacteria bacterium]|nr:hydroxymethylglutaryl-CoA reductase, degradative [Deltaproteobacteria bacterium]HPR53009.1 hydroxymethylglutaryl-CoA reductase, degradative [Deltaproteobacteria bacterium]
MSKTSRISGFHKFSVAERLNKLKEFADLTNEEIALFQNQALDLATADRMIENVVGTFEIPVGIVTNMIINGKEYLIPLVVEESSVVAGASNAAAMARGAGGFFTSNSGPLMIAQIQTVNMPDPFGAKMKILEHRDEILKIANDQDPVLVRIGGGARDLEVRVLDTAAGPMVITHLIVDVRDAMGANAVNTMAEAIAPTVEKVTGGRVYLRILSNLADRRLCRARVTVKKDDIKGGPDVADGMIQAWAFADADPYRAATNNKGIMNAITPLVIATGNDFRAIESGAHAYASRTGRYRSMSHWEKDAAGDLVGTLELPMAVGLVGGATALHPLAKLAVKILGVKTAVELGEIIVALGLCQNIAALRALAAEGIQRGHMSLHAKNIAVMAGATGDLIDEVAKRLVAEGKVRIDRAEEIIRELKK